MDATGVTAFIWSRRIKCTDEIENQVERGNRVHNPGQMTLRAACAMRIFSVRRKAHWPILGGSYVRFVSWRYVHAHGDVRLRDDDEDLRAHKDM